MVFNVQEQCVNQILHSQSSARHMSTQSELYGLKLKRKRDYLDIIRRRGYFPSTESRVLDVHGWGPIRTLYRKRTTLLAAYRDAL